MIANIVIDKVASWQQNIAQSHCLVQACQQDTLVRIGIV